MTEGLKFIELNTVMSLNVYKNQNGTVTSIGSQHVSLWHTDSVFEHDEDWVRREVTTLINNLDQSRSWSVIMHNCGNKSVVSSFKN